MTGGDHGRYDDSAAAYLLGALTELEQQAFEGHLATCEGCRDEVERLRPAADALPRSVTPLEPPPALKASIMQVVEREARERAAAERPGLGERLRGLVPRLGQMRPTVAWVSASFLLAVGLVGGFGVSQLVSGDDTRTIEAGVDRTRLPSGSASLSVSGDGEDGGILRVQGLPSPGRDRVYQAWVQRGGEIVPQSTFVVRSDGTAAAGVTEDLSDADAVMVTREPLGGSGAPGERPVLQVKL